MRTQHSRKKIERALAMLREGKTRAQVARALRMPIPTVRYHGLFNGIVSPRSYYGQRTAFAPGSRPFTAAEDETILALKAAGKNNQQIGAVLGRHRSSIRSRIVTLEQIEKRGDANDV